MCSAVLGLPSSIGSESGNSAQIIVCASASPRTWCDFHARTGHRRAADVVALHRLHRPQSYGYRQSAPILWSETNGLISLEKSAQVKSLEKHDFTYANYSQTNSETLRLGKRVRPNEKNPLLL